MATLRDDDFTHECIICFMEMTDPKLLHCGHNLCLPCVTRLPAHQQQQASIPSTTPVFFAKVKVKISCPLCQRVTEVANVTDLATNYALRGQWH